MSRIIRSRNGLNADIGRWDTPYPGGPNGPRFPGLEPYGQSILTVLIDVGSGGIANFDYAFKTYDADTWNWLDVTLITNSGSVPIISHLGKPGAKYGTFYTTPNISISVDLTNYVDQEVSLVFSVQQDGWGDQSQAEIRNLALTSCSVAPLTPLTDADAIAFERGNTVNTDGLTPAMQEALSCVRESVAHAGGSLTVNSAYRPSEYQQHLREVWDKHKLLAANTEKACKGLKKKVNAEFTRHRLLASQRPATGSGAHTRGEAIDMGASGVDLPSVAGECGLQRPLPATDPVHYTAQ